MHPPTLVIFAIILLLVDASAAHDLSPRHHRRSTGLGVYLRAVSDKRCPNRKSQSHISSSSITAKPTSTSLPHSSPTHVNNNNGLIRVNGNCAPNRATSQVTSVSGPNGHIDWMNCGFEGAGWDPPHVEVKDLITVPLGLALQNPNSPFKACAAFIPLFEKHGRNYGIPSILLASFAMQESSCRPETVGGAGEQGLMQITRDKCGGAPNNNCRDPDFNIGQGAKYFSQTLSSNGGNVFLAVGTYNGWRRRLTRWAAFDAADSSCCLCQNNGDYLMQFFNGWIRNIDPTNSNLRLGKYFNLDKCRR